MSEVSNLSGLNAEAVFSKLDWADGTVDNKITASVWNEYAANIGCNTINRFIKKENAIATIIKYLSKMTDAGKEMLTGYIDNLKQIQKKDENMPVRTVETVKQDAPENIPWDLDTPYVSKLTTQVLSNAGQTITEDGISITYDENGFPTELRKVNIENNEIVQIHVHRNDDGAISGFSEKICENNGYDVENNDYFLHINARRNYDASGRLKWYQKMEHTEDNKVFFSQYTDTGELNNYSILQYDDSDRCIMSAGYTPDGELVNYERYLNYKWGFYRSNKTAYYDGEGNLLKVNTKWQDYDANGKKLENNK